MSDVSNLESIEKFDIVSFARQILDEVESVRSYEKRFDGKTKEGYEVPTESRLNAFLRMIGLPMFVNLSLINQDSKPSKSLEGDRQLTPGFDSSLNAQLSDYLIQDAFEIAGNPIQSVLSQRETMLKSRDEIVGSPDMNKAMTLAIVSPIPLVPNLTNESGGLTTVGSANGRDTYKKLFPLIPSYREVLPRERQMARPFLPDARLATLANDALPKPFIETVARIRLGIGANSKIQEGQNDAFLNGIKDSIGSELFDAVFGKNISVLSQANVLEIYILNKLLTSVDQVAKRWVYLTEQQAKLATMVPLSISINSSSAKDNPLGKRINIEYDYKLLNNSIEGRTLQNLQLGLAVGESLLSLLPTDESSNPTGGSVLAQTKNTTKSSLNNPFISLLSSDLDYYRKAIDTINNDIKSKYINLAERVRVESELMTGEFTGLSVVDVMAVIIGLFMISKNDLLALLDRQVKENMKKDPTMKSAISSSDSSSGQEALNAFTAIKNLETQVENIFALINGQIKQVKNKGDRNRTSNRQRQKNTSQSSSSVSLSEQSKNIGEKVGNS